MIVKPYLIYKVKLYKIIYIKISKYLKLLIDNILLKKFIKQNKLSHLLDNYIKLRQIWLIRIILSINMLLNWLNIIYIHNQSLLIENYLLIIKIFNKIKKYIYWYLHGLINLLLLMLIYNNKILIVIFIIKLIILNHIIIKKIYLKIKNKYLLKIMHFLLSKFIILNLYYKLNIILLKIH
jgi:hypothetical protein